ncbi:MAG TPA: ATP-binding protein, partial [Gemmatimonadaceae bacterium]|nr:ATP-binding protein [Gemmatimonadaceae bacterium]
WTLSVAPERAFWRWLRAQQRWGESYRLRLTLALFAFFVIPAAVFAAWSWRQLQEGDLQSRELLVRETLRQATPADTVAAAAGAPPSGMPLLAYVNGVLRPDGRPLLELLAPTGRFMPPPIHERLDLATEVETSALEHVGDERLLFGYRVVSAADGERLVLAAPAPGSEEALDRRRHDLGVLVMFATVLGAFGALWLSGVAARSLAEPIGRLRGAALALAEGNLEPPLPPRPPAEFVPVFSAFRRMARDIRESRAALEEAERRTSAVLRNVASGVIAVDEEGLVVLANPRAERLLGRGIAPRAPLASAMPAELGTRLARFLAEDSAEEELDLTLEQRPLHARLTRLARGAGAVLTLDDVTELARAQRVLAWGEMARQVAHEIKNPLTPIRLGVQHLRRARADARADFDEILDRNVARILAEIDRLDQIARSFSRYGMAPAERQPPAATDVAAVTRDVVELERLGRDGVHWRLAGTDTPRAALAREDELREVLLNILENARLAGAREVAVRVAGDDGRVLIEVEDDGHGIPAHLLPRIFEPHFSTRTSGSGLGLAISRQMIEGWGGEITIRSEAGTGTVVRIALLPG